MRIAFRRWIRALCVVVAVLACTGCATTNPRDPLEPYNRVVFAFNDKVDTYATRPIGEAYRTVVPQLVRTGVRNFFSNLEDVWTSANNLLQGKVGDAAGDVMRVAINTVFGLGGIFDVASEGGLDKRFEDFGQTLGWWGVPSGPYFVLPFLGPRTIRDTASLPVDYYVGAMIPRVADWMADTGEVALRNSIYAFDYVRIRADLLDASNLVEQAAIDRYSFTRDAYLQRRRNQVYDGNPPRRKSDDDDDDARLERTTPRSIMFAGANRASLLPVEVSSGEGFDSRRPRPLPKAE